jgi:uncharacterized protein with GYD domain
MPTYATLIQFTEQGARNFAETESRAAAFKEMAAGAGVTVKDVYWTLGAYDGLILVDAPDEQSVTGVMLALSALGNVRTQTMRAFNESEMGAVVERAAGASGGARAANGGGSRRDASAGAGGASRGRRGR